MATAPFEDSGVNCLTKVFLLQVRTIDEEGGCLAAAKDLTTDDKVLPAGAAFELDLDPSLVIGRSVRLDER